MRPPVRRDIAIDIEQESYNAERFGDRKEHFVTGGIAEGVFCRASSMRGNFSWENAFKSSEPSGSFEMTDRHEFAQRHAGYAFELDIEDFLNLVMVVMGRIELPTYGL